MSRLRRISLIVVIALLVVSVAIFGVAANVGAAPAKGELKGNNGTFSWETDGAGIDIKFDPDPAKVGRCESIEFIQTCREYHNGTLVTTPSTTSPDWWFQDDDATPGGTYVDHVFCEEDPYYNGDDEQDHGDQGGCLPGYEPWPATMGDEPYVPDSSFPDGVKKITYKFEVCAYCRDTGTALGCINWEYSRTKGDAGDGTATVTSTSVCEQPSQEHQDAVNLFCNTHDGIDIHCPEEYILMEEFYLLWPYWPLP